MTGRFVMTADDLIAQARANRVGDTISPDAFTPEVVGETCEWLLGLLLDEIDYEADLRSNGAMVARALAGIAAAAGRAANPTNRTARAVAELKPE